jgi:hypothetical protein
MVGARQHVPDAVRLALPPGDIVRHVVELQGRTRSEGCLHVDDDRQRVVGDVDELRGVHGLGPRLGHDDGDRLPDEPHPGLGERRTATARVDVDEQVCRVEAEVARGEHPDDTGRAPRRPDVVHREPRVREGTTDEGAMDDALDLDVVDVTATSTDEVRVLDARNLVAQQ